MIEISSFVRSLVFQLTDVCCAAKLEFECWWKGQIPFLPPLKCSLLTHHDFQFIMLSYFTQVACLYCCSSLQSLTLMRNLKIMPVIIGVQNSLQVALQGRETHMLN